MGCLLQHWPVAAGAPGGGLRPLLAADGGLLPATERECEPPPQPGGAATASRRHAPGGAAPAPS
eukprot:3433192-Lingulodinium_polyedra.AAC.1